MPYINVKLTPEGLSPEAKAEIIRRMTRVLVDVLGKNPDTTVVILDTVETDNWGIGGDTATRRRATARQQLASNPSPRTLFR